MKSETWAAWITTGIAIIVEWDKISNFIQSFFKGISDILSSIPPLIILIIFIGMIWFLANKKK